MSLKKISFSETFCKHYIYLLELLLLIITCKNDLLFHLSTPWVHLYNLASLAVKFQTFIYASWLSLK